MLDARLQHVGTIDWTLGALRFTHVFTRFQDPRDDARDLFMSEHEAIKMT